MSLADPLLFLLLFFLSMFGFAVEDYLISRLRPFVFTLGILILDRPEALPRNDHRIPLDERLATEHAQFKFLTDDLCIFTPLAGRKAAHLTGTIRWDWVRGARVEVRYPLFEMLFHAAGLMLLLQEVARHTGPWQLFVFLVAGVGAAVGLLGRLSGARRSALVAVDELRARLTPAPVAREEPAEKPKRARLRTALIRLLSGMGGRAEPLETSSLDELVEKALRAKPSEEKTR